MLVFDRLAFHATVEKQYVADKKTRAGLLVNVPRIGA